MNRSERQAARHMGDAPRFPTDTAKLKALAYRLLGTVSDAEDAVQETYARWYALEAQDRDMILVPIAWKRTTLTRLCLDRLKSSRNKREVYVGEWLPEPINGEDLWGSKLGPSASDADLSDSISMALMIVLDKMTPPERVAFILHHVFHYTFDEISEIIDRSPQACRQLAFSARKRLDKDARRQSTREEHTKLNEAFRGAWMTGDLTALVATLDANAEAVADGGGRVVARIEPIVGSKAIADFFLTIIQQHPTLRVDTTRVNGEPGLVGTVGGEIVSVVSTSIENGKIRNIWTMRNPDKLQTWH